MDSESENVSAQTESYGCEVDGCHAKFSKHCKLVIHSRKHSGERPFKCDYDGCTKTYTNSSHLLRHKNTFHKKQETSVLCPYEGCGLVLSNKWSLKKHVSRKHNEQRDYSFRCSECNQGFHKKRQLQQHLYLHTGEAPFKCDKCEFSFTTIRECNRHKRSHNVRKCECGKEFDRWSLYLAHRKKCNSKRPQCNICDKTFSNRSNLKIHISTHMDSGNRNVHKCPYSECKRVYLYRKNLQYHVNMYHKKIHINRKIPCPFDSCNVFVKTMKNLKNHVQLHYRTKVKKLARKVRRDKGKPKKCMASRLTQIELSKEENLALISRENVCSSISSDSENKNLNSDEQIFEQCDNILNIIEKLTSNTSESIKCV